MGSKQGAGGGEGGSLTSWSKSASEPTPPLSVTRAKPGTVPSLCVLWAAPLPLGLPCGHLPPPKVTQTFAATGYPPCGAGLLTY